MQYEIIILELMNRIKQVESRCDEVEEILAHLLQEPETAEEAAGDTTRRQRVTPEQMRACYDCAVQLFGQAGAGFSAAIDTLVDETRMNRNSAISTVNVVRNMLAGKGYTRAISHPGTVLFWEAIKKDFGAEALKKAIQATRDHVAYRRQFGHPVDSLERLCEEYEQGLRAGKQPVGRSKKKDARKDEK